MRKPGTDLLIHQRGKNATDPVGDALIYVVRHGKVSKYNGDAYILVLRALQ